MNSQQFKSEVTKLFPNAEDDGFFYGNKYDLRFQENYPFKVKHWRVIGYCKGKWVYSERNGLCGKGDSLESAKEAFHSNYAEYIRVTTSR